MSRETNQQIAAGFAQGLQNFVQGYTQRKAAEKEQSRVRDLMARLQSASDVEKVGIYGQIDPKLALQFEMNQEKNKLKQQQQQMIMNEYRNLAEAPQGGDQGQKTQIVDPQGSDVQPGYSVSGPSMAARNQTMPNFPGNKNFMQEPVVAAPQVNAPPVTTQEQQAQQNPYAIVDQLRQRGAYLDSIQPGSGKGMYEQANGLEKRLLQAQESQVKMGTLERKERMDIHKSFDKEDKAISTAAKQARGQMHAFDTMKKNIATGKLTPTNFTNLTRKALENTRWKDFFLNPEQAEFQAATLETYEGMKEMFGGKITDADLRLASGKVPDLNKSDDANLAIIDFLEFKARMKEAEAEIGDEIKDENGGYRPINYTSQIRKRMQERFGKQAEELTRKAAYEGEVGPKFDIANPEHKARRDAILKSVNGDFEKAKQLLDQEFIP